MRKSVAPLVLCVAVGACGGCRQSSSVQAAANRRVVRLVSDTTTTQPLALEYSRSLPDVEVRLIGASGSGSTVAALQRGEADLGFVLADVAYFANQQAEESSPKLTSLRGVAALQTASVQILARQGLTLEKLAKLRTPKIGTNAAFSSQGVFAALVFGAYGLGLEHLERKPIAYENIPEALASGSLDAVFVTAYYPAPAVSASARMGAQLLPVDGEVAERLRLKYPFLRRLMIPANTYPGQTTAVHTIGVDRLLVCRRELDEALVHDLTRSFVDALPRIVQSLRASSRLMDLDHAPATPIPLHRGAAQYYRERELTP
jgi:TRAP transporter TAXI family solute receptor